MALGRDPRKRGSWYDPNEYVTRGAPGDPWTGSMPTYTGDSGSIGGGRMPLPGGGIGKKSKPPRYKPGLPNPGGGGAPPGGGGGGGGMPPYKFQYQSPQNSSYNSQSRNGYIDQLMAQMSGANMEQWLTQGDQTGSTLGNFYNYPGRIEDSYNQYLARLGDNDSRYQYLDNQVTGLDPAVQRGNAMWPQMFDNLDYLNKYGLPGNQELQGDMSYLSGTGRTLLGGNGQYGVTDLLSQIMTEGLPNQRGVEALFEPQSEFGQKYQTRGARTLDEAVAGRGNLRDPLEAAGGNLLRKPLRAAAPTQIKPNYGYLPESVSQLGGYGQNLLGREYEFETPEDLRRASGITPRLLYQTPSGASPIQNKSIERSSEMLDQGGLSSDYVKSMRDLILEPELEETERKFNKNVRGEAAADSGLAAELNRRTTRDFNNTLLRTGYENYSDALDRGGKFGQQTYDQDLANRRQESSNLLGAGALLTDTGKYTGDLGVEGARLGLTAAGTGAGLLKDQAGLEADYYGRQVPELDYRSQLANQTAGQRADEADIQAQLDSYGVGGRMASDLYNRDLNASSLYRGYGQDAYDNAFKAFESPSKTAYPYISDAGRLGLGSMGQAEQNFGSLSKYGLQNLRDIADIGSMPLEQSQVYGGRNADRYGRNSDRYGNLLDSMLGGAGNLYRTEGNLGVDRARLGYGLGGQIAGGEYGLQEQDLRNQAAIDIAKSGALGSAGSSILSWLLKNGGKIGGKIKDIFTGGGEGSPGTEPGSPGTGSADPGWDPTSDTVEGSGIDWESIIGSGVDLIGGVLDPGGMSGPQQTGGNYYGLSGWGMPGYYDPFGNFDPYGNAGDYSMWAGGVGPGGYGPGYVGSGGFGGGIYPTHFSPKINDYTQQYYDADYIPGSPGL